MLKLNFLFQLSDFDVEDMVVDIGYWFKASTKRKCRLDGKSFS